MNYAWICPIPLEKAIAKDPLDDRHASRWRAIRCSSSTSAASAWSTRSCTTTSWRRPSSNGTARRPSIPNLVLISIWDQRSQDNSASHEYGRLIVPPGTDDRHVIKGNTLEELAANIDERFAEVRRRDRRHALHRRFPRATCRRRSRVQRFAKTGKDLDFNRGERSRGFALQRRREGRARAARTRRCGRSATPGHITPRWCRRDARHQGRAEDQHARPGAGQRRQADPGPLRRGQLRGFRIRSRVLGRWRERSGRSSPSSYRTANAASADAGVRHERRTAARRCSHRSAQQGGFPMIALAASRWRSAWRWPAPRSARRPSRRRAPRPEQLHAVPRLRQGRAERRRPEPVRPVGKQAASSPGFTYSKP